MIIYFLFSLLEYSCITRVLLIFPFILKCHFCCYYNFAFVFYAFWFQSVYIIRVVIHIIILTRAFSLCYLLCMTLKIYYNSPVIFLVLISLTARNWLFFAILRYTCQFLSRKNKTNQKSSAAFVFTEVQEAFFSFQPHFALFWWSLNLLGSQLS